MGQLSDVSSHIRREYILHTINKTGFAKVNEISEKFNVSLVTVRKDLALLERHGLLLRVYGGAVKNHPSALQNILAADKMNIKAEEKKKIASATIDLIKDNESIIINMGSTSAYVAQRFKEKNNLIVITNALQIFNIISPHKNVTSFFLGGRFDHEMQFTYGDDTIDQLSKYKADKLIIGMDGIDIKAGATTYNHPEGALMHAMIKCSKEKILIVDDSKFGKVAFEFIAPLATFDVIVTNYVEKNEPFYKKLRKMGIQVITTNRPSLLYAPSKLD